MKPKLQIESKNFAIYKTTDKIYEIASKNDVKEFFLIERDMLLELRELFNKLEL